ncbi:hypothetical protein KCTC52924_00384 [Arenibacter antarcticus]|uniref:Transmembrane family 220, helix n=1 Tax=Arenibacter antarcticus TaxID=2040469 RepID=A0ABW5VF65_9FLAO|nr:hypothetical protein [Arenibacter sp. H213]MCM4169603.1 hypothetical protein [Arenibacter sp. H213]
MKNNLINFAITVLLAVLLSQFLPWWSVMVAAFITSIFISLKHSAVFFVPFLAVGVFWLAYAWGLANNNNFILTQKLATLFQMEGNATLLLLITALIGGVAAGVTAIFGKQCRQLVMGDR